MSPPSFPDPVLQRFFRETGAVGASGGRSRGARAGPKLEEAAFQSTGFPLDIPRNSERLAATAQCSESRIASAESAVDRFERSHSRRAPPPRAPSAGKDVLQTKAILVDVHPGPPQRLMTSDTTSLLDGSPDGRLSQ